jgi:phosphohistidine phosphatase
VSKRLWLLRHAKSDWDKAGLVDHKRPLNKRGRRSAADVGETVRREGIAPDVVLVSIAVRAQETAAALGLATTPAPKLYNADAGEMLAQLRGLPDEVGSVMLVGHNPGMEDLASQLGDQGGMSTATLVAFDVETDTWADIDPARATSVGRWEHPGR